jgi:hypothetical protein
MQKCFGRVLLLKTVALSCCLMGASEAIADENTSGLSENLSETSPQLEVVDSVESNINPTLETDFKTDLKAELGTEQGTESFHTDSSNSSNHANEMGQVNSVFLLRDVSATDWAFQSLKSLVEKYSCIAGYPDGTFRGNRALSRYEFAAVLDSCLRQVETLINSGSAPSKEDLDA